MRILFFALLGVLVSGGCGFSGEVSGKVHSSLMRPSGTAQRAVVRYAGQTGSPGAVAPVPKPRAIVYLEGSFTEAQLAAARKARGKAEIGQEGFRFDPNLMAVIRGTRVAFPNRDADYHNVFSYSKTKKFDLGRYKSDAEVPVVEFDKAGVVHLFCEIHKHMRGTVLVLETPYFVTTAEDGSFLLKGVPAGEYVLVAWVSEKVQDRRKVKVSAAGRLEVVLGLKK